MVSKDFHHFNQEINDFYAFLKENKYSDEEIRRIFAPLRPNFSRVPKLAALAILVLFALYFLTYFESVSWHLSAISRIILIDCVLPFYDWTALKNEKCLIKYSTDGIATPVNETFNCQLCEDLIQVEVLDNFDQFGRLKERYLDLHSPVVLKNIDKSDNFTNLTPVNLISQLIGDVTYAESVPCTVSTNIYDGIGNIGTLLRQTDLFGKFFLHFQNCDLRAVKVFRRFVGRPSSLPPDLAPIQYSWLLWSRNYVSLNYKNVDLIDKIAVFGQIAGSNSVRVVPRVNCKLKCHDIDVNLTAGEFLIITALWDIKYKPNEMGENLAVILETH